MSRLKTVSLNELSDAIAKAETQIKLLAEHEASLSEAQQQTFTELKDKVRQLREVPDEIVQAAATEASTTNKGITNATVLE